jgi:hypothetical protein
MSLRKLLGGLERQPVRAKRSTRSLRPGLEGLEQREVMTVAFTPALGAETISWRTSVAGHTAGTALTGPVTNPTALDDPTVYLIFSGSSWTSTTAVKYAFDVKAILASGYLSGLTQYGSSGTATYGGYTIDPRPSPGPSGRDAEIQYALDELEPAWKPTGAPGYLTSPVYVVIDDNGGSAASNGGGSYTKGGTTFLTNAINIDNGTNEDTFTDLFSQARREDLRRHRCGNRNGRAGERRHRRGVSERPDRRQRARRRELQLQAQRERPGPGLLVCRGPEVHRP